MFYIYVIKLVDGTFYKGQTEDIEKRLQEHKSKQVPATKNKLPFKLIHVEVCDTRREARILEKYFKSGFGREIIHEIAEVAEWQTRMV